MAFSKEFRDLHVHEIPLWFSLEALHRSALVTNEREEEEFWRLIGDHPFSTGVSHSRASSGVHGSQEYHNCMHSLVRVFYPLVLTDVVSVVVQGRWLYKD